MGLDYASAHGADGAAGDPDGDGLTNLQEQTAGSHPRGTASRFLAEGADNAFFKTRLGIANPGTTGGDGRRALRRRRRHVVDGINVHVPAGARRTVFVDEVARPRAVVLDGRRVERRRS